MASLQDFETTLKEVVHAKRLSASKMTKLTDIAMKLIEDDTQLVSTLYRTHKTLPPSSKISSLYVFDALSRAARHHVNKHGLTSDKTAHKGNPGTFLLKIEGVLEGLFQDMVSTGNSDCKEKSRKIVDIWIKGNTFSAAVLSQLRTIIERPKEEAIPTPPLPRPSSQPTADPRRVASTSNGTPTTTPASDPQATLLALLSKAVSATASSKPHTSKSAESTSHISPELALLQQLKQTAHLSGAPSGYGSSTNIPQQSQSPSQIPSLHDTYGSFSNPPYNHIMSGSNQNRGSDQPYPGLSRGGGYRARGAANGRNNRNDHERFQSRDKGRQRHSRSRSPPNRYGGGGNTRHTYSPPRRPSLAQSRDYAPSPVRESATDKDEFGRDLRTGSDDDTLRPEIRTQESSQLPNPAVIENVVEHLPVVTPNNLDQSIGANDSMANSGVLKPIDTSYNDASTSGMENFNIAMFDFTSPASWEGLGKMWQVTNGYLPSTEELMQFVMSAANPSMQSQTLTPMPMPVVQRAPENGNGNGSQWAGRGRGRGRGRGFSRGGGSMGYGSMDKYSHQQWNNDNTHMASDAIVLGGGDADSVDVSHNDSPVAQAGRMQQVGDKWVFMKDSVVSGVS